MSLTWTGLKDVRAFDNLFCGQILWKPFPMISLVFEIRMKASLSFSRIKLRSRTACTRLRAVKMIYLSLPE